MQQGADDMMERAHGWLLCLMGRHDHKRVGSVGLALIDRHRVELFICRRCERFGVCGGEPIGRVWRYQRWWRSSAGE